MLVNIVNKTRKMVGNVGIEPVKLEPCVGIEPTTWFLTSVLQTAALPLSVNRAYCKLAGTVGLAPTIFRVRTEYISIMLHANLKLEPPDRLALSYLVYETNTSLSMFRRRNWGVRRDLNSHLPDSQSGALNQLCYIHHSNWSLQRVTLLRLSFTKAV